MTLHSAKGLEFPYVFIVGMEERLFPSGLSIDSDDPDAVEEERRLCYVGITRAMKRLYLSSSRCRMINGSRMYGSESRFISEIPNELIRRSGYGNRVRQTNRESVQRIPASSSIGMFTRSSSGSASGTGKNLGLGALSGISKGMPSSSGDYDYEVGDKVKHIKFGVGTVTEKIKSGSDYEVTVNFDKIGEKKLFASLAKLKKV